METLSGIEKRLPKEKAMLMFATGGVQNNYTRERVPADHHVIFVWDEAGGLTHDRLVSERDSIDVGQVFRRIGIRLPSVKPADMEVGYDASMTAEEFAEKIRCQAAGLPRPREYEIVGIVPDVFGFNEEFVAKVAEYYGINCASVKTAELLGDKAAFGGLLGEMEFPVPRERMCDAPIDEGREGQILAATEEIGTATIMKPNDGAGSIGCERDDPSLPMEARRRRVGRHLAETVRYQDQFSRRKASMTLVQERISGDEVGLQLMVNKGYLFPFYTRKGMYGNKERGHYYDEADPLHDWCQTYVSPHLPRMIGRLGIKDWFFNGDIKIPKEWRQMPVRSDNPVLFAPDVSPGTPAMFYLLDGQSRPGGDGLAVMQSKIFGKNFNQYMIDIALGKDVRKELSETKPGGAAGVEVGFPDGGIALSKLNYMTFADTLEDGTSGILYVNLANILMCMYANELTPLTSFFHSGEHPIVGVSGENTADVRRKLDRAFSMMGRTLYTHGGIDMYHPDHGLMQIRGAGGEPLTFEEAQEFVQRLGDPTRPELPPFVVHKIEHSE